MITRSTSNNGFTLIEVLLAAAILGVGLGMMLTGASRCLAAMKQARKYQEAQWTLNRGLLDHPLLPTDEVDDWNISGETYDNGLTFSREVEEEPIDEEDGLFLVRSRVVWWERGREGREEIVQYFLNLEAIE
jgi:prepilin-type N-terminal cleavage/methylation domain-containing protein